MPESSCTGVQLEGHIPSHCLVRATAPVPNAKADAMEVQPRANMADMINTDITCECFSHPVSDGPQLRCRDGVLPYSCPETEF